MRRVTRSLLLAVPPALLAGALFAATALAADEAEVKKEGKEIAFNRRKGNCLACHAIDDGESPGTIGPPLFSMQQRFKSQADLRAQIWDATKRNPETTMPPFGRHGILSESDLDKVAAYIWSL